MKIRKLNDEEVVRNMLELALYLANLDENKNDIEIEVNGLFLHFECGTERMIENDRD